MSNSSSFLDLFNPPTLEELMSMYQYRSGAGLYDNLLRSEMEEFVANAADFQLDFTKALQSIESAVQAGATSVQRTVVIPVDIETNVDIQIDYVLDINHTVSFTVNGTLTAEYGQEITLTAEDIDWSEDPITGFSRSMTVPNDGDEYKLALFDNDELTGFRRREGYDPTFADLEAVHGEGSVALSGESGFDGEQVLFTISAADRAEVDSFGKGGSDWALYNVTDDTFGSHEGWAGTGGITVAELIGPDVFM